MNLNTSGFIDITIPGDPWRVFLDPKTETIHDGREYYRQCFGLEKEEP